MTIRVLREVTEWDVTYKQPNHTYLVISSKVVAYKKWHDGELMFFKNPKNLDKRYRQFKELKFKPTEWKIA
jgi:hypothetical protein